MSEARPGDFVPLDPLAGAEPLHLFSKFSRVQGTVSPGGGPGGKAPWPCFL
jgi:hypothetical protein